MFIFFCVGRCQITKRRQDTNVGYRTFFIQKIPRLIAGAILVKNTRVEMCRITRIPKTRLNVSLMSQTEFFSQCNYSNFEREFSLGQLYTICVCRCMCSGAIIWGHFSPLWTGNEHLSICVILYDTYTSVSLAYWDQSSIHTLFIGVHTGVIICVRILLN